MSSRIAKRLRIGDLLDATAPFIWFANGVWVMAFAIVSMTGGWAGTGRTAVLLAGFWNIKLVVDGWSASDERTSC